MKTNSLLNDASRFTLQEIKMNIESHKDEDEFKIVGIVTMNDFAIFQEEMRVLSAKDITKGKRWVERKLLVNLIAHGAIGGASLIESQHDDIKIVNHEVYSRPEEHGPESGEPVQPGEG